ncbi:hypothetical protein SPBR_07441 [Sporothrix brasiliensis 5110]|uniref:BZIP domain-containing protein n=1 Tax=Sporothrix brasiliensis 5110 TaxID=1398154 RepID=A0A0C2IWY1_9PEZI|nr:uncharacterized protein SPBR_07441 [Sporothrix brasiliensis 5110]KIH89547.1 hypothetical protein SPBR_07441 [Sporothrix brasiliensis 5110]
MAPQSDEANLARIRDNQRRSRARRKEYQQELEQRVRAFEEQGVEASTEVQHAARRVADENKKLRRLLQQSGVSHAAVEAYLHGGSVGDVDDIDTGDTGDSGPPGANVATLEHLMVPRFPLQYASPLLSGGSLSAAGSVGPSSPSGGGGVDETTMTTSSGGGSSAHRGSGGSSVHGKSEKSHSHGHGHSHGHSHSHGHRDKGKRASSTSAAGTTTTTGPSTADYARYLSPGYGLSTAFYGLDETSAEDLHYGSSSGGGGTEAGGGGGGVGVGTGAEPILFDYSVSPQYLGEGGGGTTFGTGSVSGVSQPPASAPYYGMMGSGSAGGGGGGNTTGSYVRTCPACMSGMGCQVHGGFFEE